MRVYPLWEDEGAKAYGTTKNAYADHKHNPCIGQYDEPIIDWKIEERSNPDSYRPFGDDDQLDLWDTRKKKTIRAESTDANLNEHQNDCEVKSSAANTITGEPTNPENESSIPNKENEEHQQSVAAPRFFSLRGTGQAPFESEHSG